jgi:hypothetical protein
MKKVAIELDSRLLLAMPLSTWMYFQSAGLQAALYDGLMPLQQVRRADT